MMTRGAIGPCHEPEETNSKPCIGFDTVLPSVPGSRKWSLPLIFRINSLRISVSSISSFAVFLACLAAVISISLSLRKVVSKPVLLMCVLTWHIALRHSSCLKHLHVFRDYRLQCNLRYKDLCHILMVVTFVLIVGTMRRKLSTPNVLSQRELTRQEMRKRSHLCLGGLLLSVPPGPDSPEACSTIGVRKL